MPANQEMLDTAEKRIPLTEKQYQVMEFVQDFIATRGISPTLQEIAEGRGGVTKITIYEHLNQLQRKGVIRRKPNEARSIKILQPVATRKSRAKAIFAMFMDVAGIEPESQESPDQKLTVRLGPASIVFGADGSFEKVS